MNTKRTFKKELPRDKLLSIVLSYLKEIDKEDRKIKIIKLLEALSAEIVTAETCKLWMIDYEKKIFYSESFLDNERIEISWGKGLLNIGLDKADAFYINNITENKLYDPSIDNIENREIKDIIILPVTDENAKVLFIIEAATSKNDLQQFTENDLNALHSIQPYLTDNYPLLLEDRSNKVTNENEHILKNMETLKKDKKRAEAMVDSSTQFLAEVAHEIRTPMNAVMGFIDLLRVDEKDKEKLIYLESAAKSGEMMIALINDLLDFSKIEKGMMELETIHFNPIEEFNVMAPLFCARMKKKDILFKLFLDPMLPKEIVSDPHRIKQILSNLLGNAIKFTPEKGEITLEILYNQQAKQIDFSVIDTGIGIAKENQSKIFESYTQETNSTSRKFGGTGLGLSISSKLAEKFGDKLQVESKEGEGSRFYFSLKNAVINSEPMINFKALKKVKPALLFSEEFRSTKALVQRYLIAFGIPKEAIAHYNSCEKVDKNSFTHLFSSPDLIDYSAVQKTLDEHTPVTIFKQTAFDFYMEDLKGPIDEIECTFGPDRLYNSLAQNLTQPKADKNEFENKKRSFVKKKILVVDDNHLNVHFIREVVKKLGAVVESAYDGDEAVEVYQRAQAWKDPFDLILMDENMPHMNGTEAAKIIIALEKEHAYPHTVIIGISGDATEEQREKSIAFGMDECIFKPVGIKKIIEVFEQFLP